MESHLTRFPLSLECNKKSYFSLIIFKASKQGLDFQNLRKMRVYYSIPIFNRNSSNLQNCFSVAANLPFSKYHF